jgi:hypothetical protein
MRPLLLLPALLTILACGPDRLTPREAERDIRKDYPVAVVIRVPDSARAVKGSPEFANLVKLQDGLVPTGWFLVTRNSDGDHEQFNFRLTPNAPATIHTGPKGFLLQAAEADFVRVVGLKPTRDGARVTYQIRLVRPTAAFPLFQSLHPGVKIADTKDRFATYRQEHGDWILQETDETFKKAE